jgi:electron transfer flavoprotein beta subunit
MAEKTSRGPALLTVSDRILQPTAVKNGVTPDDHAYPESDSGRYASLKGIMKAKKKPIEELELGSLDIDAAPLTEHSEFALPPARSGETAFVENAQELIEKLHTEAKVL